MMGTEMVLQTSVIFNQLTWLVGRENFINVCRRESFRSYILWHKLTITCGQQHLRKTEAVAVNEKHSASLQKLSQSAVTEAT
jgi:hypothetical protein